MSSTVKVSLTGTPAVVMHTDFEKRLLDHLTEAAFFTGKDMESISHTLNKMQGILERGKEGHSPQLLHLLNSRMVLCRKLLADLNSNLDGLSSALVPVHERLVSILRSIAAANTRSKAGPALDCFVQYLKSRIVSHLRGRGLPRPIA